MYLDCRLKKNKCHVSAEKIHAKRIGKFSYYKKYVICVLSSYVKNFNDYLNTRHDDISYFNLLINSKD